MIMNLRNNISREAEKEYFIINGNGFWLSYIPVENSNCMATCQQQHTQIENDTDFHFYFVDDSNKHILHLNISFENYLMRHILILYYTRIT